MPESLDTQLIGIPPADLLKVKNVLETFRRTFADILTPVTLTEQEVDSRVLQVRADMDKVNERRMARYGRAYEPPEVIFIDRKRALYEAESINLRLQRELPALGKFDAHSAFHQAEGNFIVLFTHNFEDPDIDAYDSAWRLRHELSHAGSVKKIRAYGYGLKSYRVGAKLNSDKRESGLVVDEGFRAIEDALFRGDDLPFAGTSIESSLEDMSTRIPGAREKYSQLYAQVVSRQLIPDGKMMTHFLPSIYKVGYCDSYDTFKELMLKLFQKDPGLFAATEDLIYADRMIAFAKRITETYGDGMFHRLMSLQGEEGAKALLEGITES